VRKANDTLACIYVAKYETQMHTNKVNI